MTTTAPDRSLQQRQAALKRANDIRYKRAQFKRDLKAGRVNPHDYLLDPPSWLETMKIVDVVKSLPKHGRVKTNKVLHKVRMSPSKTVGGMSQRQRTELVAILRHS